MRPDSDEFYPDVTPSRIIIPSSRADADAEMLDAYMKKEIYPRALDVIHSHTVPLYFVQDPELGIQRDRSGVLYTIGGRYFILTASHKLQRMLTLDDLALYVHCDADDSLPIPLVDCLFHGTEEEGRDVAVIALTDALADELKKTKRFLTHSDIKLNDSSNTSLYALYGYPSDWTYSTDSGVGTTGFGLFTSRYRGRLSATAFYDSNVNIVVELKDRAYSAPSGTRDYLPRMQGISGCGIWRVLDLSDRRNITNWTPDVIALVGLQHRWHKDRDYTQGSWTGIALEIIAREYPDVASAMRIIY